MSPRGKGASLLYWIPTTLVGLVMLSGGVFDAIQTETALEVFDKLGYPAYFSTILGVAKILGTIALFAPVPRTVREWAYAGFTFDVLAAIASILAVGNPVTSIGIPMFCLLMLQTSYVMWRLRLRGASEPVPAPVPAVSRAFA